MQLRKHYEDGKYFDCNIPNEYENVFPGVPWGNVSVPFTPAFWRLACIANGAVSDQNRYHLGKSLSEEVIACLLGGHGVTGELGLAAFNHLKDNKVTDRLYSISEIENLLSQPLVVGHKKIKYRYPKQKAKYIYGALEHLRTNKAPLNDGKLLRDWLMMIPGIGYKTASWVVRNWLDSKDVAILDIHIHRAGIIAGIFSPNEDVSKEYLKMEEKFIGLAEGIGIPANILDNQIWNELRCAPGTVRKMLLEKGVQSSDRCGLPSANNSRASRNYDLFSTV